ncbi:MAG: hypothetical protein UZ13_00124, partial [Chloroflexi bacterium OLB13]
LDEFVLADGLTGEVLVVHCYGLIWRIP